MGSATAVRRTLTVVPWIVAAALAGQPARPDFDARRLATGIFRYRTLVDGREAGKSKIRIRRADSGEFVFTNEVTGAFRQSWEAVATRDLVPRSARLTTGAGPESRVVFELAYGNGRVTGFATSAKAEGGFERRAVDDPVAADTVDQRIDWAAVMALPEYPPGSEIAFRVYDPGTGHSRATARVIGPEKTSVLAGTFDTVRVVYRIEKNRGAETYEVWIRAAVPRFLVKERFPNGAVTVLGDGGSPWAVD